MDDDTRPVVLRYGYPRTGSQFTFLGSNAYIDIEGHNATLAWLLPRCTGIKSVSELEGDFPGNATTLRSLLDTLEEYGIVVPDSRVYLRFHEESSNPHYAADLGRSDSLAASSEFISDVATSRSGGPVAPALSRLIENRRTTRTFSGQPVRLELLRELLACMYDISTQHPVPSAGAIFPFSLDIGIIGGNPDLSPGVYRYQPERHAVVRRAELPAIERLTWALDESALLDGGPILIFLCADIQRHTSKYGNRGYRYSLIEAGHIAQNAQLFCSEVGLGIFEYGGFRDTALGRLLQLPSQEEVLLILGIGLPSSTESESTEHAYLIDRLQADLGETGPKIRLLPPAYLEHISFAARTASYESGSGTSRTRELASGTGWTQTIAALRATAEAYERWASGQIRIDVTSSAQDLDLPWVSPNQLTPYSEEQYEAGLPLTRFDLGAVTEWRVGRRTADLHSVCVAIDNVYYPLDESALPRVPFYRGNSSGVAAHRTNEQATPRALLELIERDALMVMWHSKKPPKQVDPTDLSQYLNERKSAWQSRGREVRLFDLTLDSTPVALVGILGSAYPCFVSGAAAAFDFKTAATKAFREAELMLATYLHQPRIDPPAAERVASPEDHGAFYFDSERARELEWILDAEMTSEPPTPWTNDLSALQEQFDTIEIDLTCSATEALHVSRVVSEILLPIHFGYGFEHVGHPRLATLGLDWRREFPAVPHFFA